MNYIYDITLNFSKTLYNFYEWDRDDNIDFYLKIPVIKVEEKVVYDLINTDFILDKKTLNKIINKTEKYSKTSVKSIKYACIFTSTERAIAVCFNEKGESVLKSYLSIDEEGEVLEFSKIIKYSLIDYRVKNKYLVNKNYYTRNELKTRNNIKNIIKKIYKNKEFDKLKYIFYEVYNEKNCDEKIIYIKLNNLLDGSGDKITRLKEIIDTFKEKTKIG